MAEAKQNVDSSAVNLAPKASFPIDLVRALAIFLVVLLHVSIEPIIVPSSTIGADTWWASFTFYNSIARPCVPLFVMLSGYLLLQPQKVTEPLKVFFKKRWARIGLPFIFWGAVFFVWAYFFDAGSFSFGTIVQDMLQGPYVTFWFLYMLVGLYLLTPILRVFMAYASDNIMKFIFVVWFIGTGLMPLAGLLGFNLNSNVFILPGWIGFYLLGAYLPKLKSKVRPLWLYGLLAVGLAWTMVGSFFMELESAPQLYFFYDYLTANVILASSAMFLLLISISNASFESKPSMFKRFVHAIGQNTLPIYLFHMILVEAFAKGLFGFTLNILTVNPLIMTPVLATIVFFISSGVVLAMKQVPYLKNIIG